jgi:hypothetical protein
LSQNYPVKEVQQVQDLQRDLNLIRYDGIVGPFRGFYEQAVDVLELVGFDTVLVGQLLKNLKVVDDIDGGALLR